MSIMVRKLLLVSNISYLVSFIIYNLRGFGYFLSVQNNSTVPYRSVDDLAFSLTLITLFVGVVLTSIALYSGSESSLKSGSYARLYAIGLLSVMPILGLSFFMLFNLGLLLLALDLIMMLVMGLRYPFSHEEEKNLKIWLLIVPVTILATLTFSYLDLQNIFEDVENLILRGIAMIFFGLIAGSLIMLNGQFKVYNAQIGHKMQQSENQDLYKKAN